MKKIFLNEKNKIHKEIYVLLISLTLFIGAITFTHNYISADEPKNYEKPTELEVRKKLDSAVESGKLTQEEADSKLEAILSGEMKKKRPGKFGKKPTELEVRKKLDSAVESGKLTQEEADSKLEAILSGEMKGKYFIESNPNQIIL